MERAHDRGWCGKVNRDLLRPLVASEGGSRVTLRRHLLFRLMLAWDIDTQALQEEFGDYQGWMESKGKLLLLNGMLNLRMTLCSRQWFAREGSLSCIERLCTENLLPFELDRGRATSEQPSPSKNRCVVFEHSVDSALC